MIYGYLRVSTDKQDVDVQKQGIIFLAKKNDWEIDDWIIDDGVSGTKDPEKRQLGKLMKKCKEGDTIICSELSRLGRKLLMVMSILEYCMKNKIMIHTVKDNYVLGDNIQSAVLAFAFSLAAQIERDMISLRTIEGLRHRKMLGVLLGNKRGERAPNKASDEAVKKMKTLLDQGVGITEIARKLKMNRGTVGYYLTRAGYYKGPVVGYKMIMKDGNEIDVNYKNCSKFGFSYSFIRNAATNKNEGLSLLGVKSVEPIIDEIKGSYDRRSFYVKSEHPLINHEQITKLVDRCMTIPEIHQEIEEVVDYFTLYDYICGDTDLSMAYREKGHLRVKSKKEKY